MYDLGMIWPFVAIALLAVGVPTPAVGSGDEPRSLADVAVVRRDNGWHIPGLDAAGTVERVEHHRATNGDYIRKSFLNAHRPLVEVEHYSVGPSGQLQIGVTTCIVYEIQACERGGTTFAYIVNLNPVSVDIHGRRTHMGAMYLFGFVDEDGNGSFETRLNYLDKVTIPEWAKALPLGQGF